MGDHQKVALRTWANTDTMNKRKRHHKPYEWLDDLLIAGIIVGGIAYAVYGVVRFWPYVVNYFQSW